MPPGPDLVRVGSMTPGTLFVISTPIGNWEDITLRALRVLKEVDVIAAEEPLQSRPLLDQYGIDTPLTSYHNLNKEEKAPVLIQRLLEGQNVGLIADAGTPAVCDPGALFISAALSADILIVPVPGVSAVLAAVSVCGFSGDGFVFYGFLPKQDEARRCRLDSLRSESRPVVIFEGSESLTATLHDIHACLGNRRMMAASDLTKPGERLLRGRIKEILKTLASSKMEGEITLVIDNKRPGNPRVGKNGSRRIRKRSASGS